MSTASTSARAEVPSGAVGAGGAGLAGRLRAVRVGLREDLQVSRHVFRSDVKYVVRDPISFQSHCFDARDYDVLVRLTSKAELGAIFQGLVREGRLGSEREEAFYEFVVSAHRLGFLSLPVSDEKGLYRRFEQRRKAKRRALLWAWMSFQQPMWNPDAFLGRTLPWVSWLFTRWAFVCWAALMAIMGTVVAIEHDRLIGSLGNLLAAEQLVAMWFVLIVLKVAHEMGHAYACKKFGGVVPEIGAMFILMTPCAYMDASSAWGFPKRAHRLIVSLAGMYVETMIAGAALLVWAATEPSPLNALALQVFVLAGVVTVGFNVNPLMRFDGYYILSDLLEVPNLRARANRAALSELHRLTLGVRTDPEPARGWLRPTLVLFAAASAVYKVLLVLGISTVIATKFFLVGALLAGGYMAKQLLEVYAKSLRFLLRDPILAGVRARAMVVGVVGLAAIPVATMMLPMPMAMTVDGVVEASVRQMLKAPRAGTIGAVSASLGEEVGAGRVVVMLEDRQLEASVERAQAELAVALAKLDVARSSADRSGDDVEAGVWARARQEQLLLTAQGQQDLAVASHQGGTVIALVDESDIGRYVEAGTTLGEIASGGSKIVVLMDEASLDAAEIVVGSTVPCRPFAASERTVIGVVRSVGRVGEREIDRPALTVHAGGQILADPRTGRTDRAWYSVEIDLGEVDRADAVIARALAHGSRVRVMLGARQGTIGLELWRSLLRFRDRLQTSA